MTWFGAAAFVFLVIRFLVAAFNYFSQPVLNGKVQQKEAQLISVLIPARNEEKNLPLLLHSLLKQQYENIKVLVLDDHSTDKTFVIAENFAAMDKRINVMKGKELPHDWLGKNWACHQLAESADGDYFLYLDADVQLDENAIASLVAEMVEKNVSLLSIFPHQKMISVGENLVVPLVNFLLLSLLPLRFVYRFRMFSLAAANGQCMLFNATDYRKNKWHEQVKNKIAEDIAIAQQMKKQGFPVETLLSNSEIECRMYHNMHEAIAGFRKNIISIFGNSVLFLLTFLTLTTAGVLTIFLVLSEIYSLIAIALIVGIRTFVSLSSKQSVIKNVLLHPIQMLLIVWIGILSFISKSQGKVAWKGRDVQV